MPWLSFLLKQLKLIEIVFSLSALRKVSQQLMINMAIRSAIVESPFVIISLAESGSLAVGCCIHLEFKLQL